MKRIILCADDYGQNSVISQAIIELFEKNRLSATSVLSTSDDWENLSKQLHPFKNSVDIGLHLNLTEGTPLSRNLKAFASLPSLIVRSFAGVVDRESIYHEFEAQLDRFIDCMGQFPDFIDGHQHIHQLPLIRDVVVSLWKKRLERQGIYLRCTYQPGGYLQWNKSGFVKRLIIQLCGAHALKKELIKNAIPHNDSFEGIYDFAQSVNYPQIFLGFLQRIQNNGLIMCHTGMKLEGDSDPISIARFHEYQYLKSDQFTQDCIRQGVEIGRFETLPKR